MNTPSGSSSEIGARKKKQVEICVDEPAHSVEVGPSAGFDGVSFVHQALPDVDAGAVDTRVRFLDHDLALPLFVSCMTGGSTEGFAVSREAREGAVGSGNERQRPSRIGHFGRHEKGMAVF